MIYGYLYDLTREIAFHEVLARLTCWSQTLVFWTCWTFWKKQGVKNKFSLSLAVCGLLFVHEKNRTSLVATIHFRHSPAARPCSPARPQSRGTSGARDPCTQRLMVCHVMTWLVGMAGTHLWLQPEPKNLRARENDGTLKVLGYNSYQLFYN